MHKNLVVYFSRTGFTRTAAQLLARALDADVDEIREDRSRAGIVGYLRSGFEAIKQKHPPIQRPRLHPRTHARVIIGTPVWAGHMSSPVRSYLLEHRADLHRYALFCTCGGRGGAQVLDEMERLVGRAAEARLVLTDREIRDHNDAAPARFVRALLHVAGPS